MDQDSDTGGFVGKQTGMLSLLLQVPACRDGDQDHYSNPVDADIGSIRHFFD